MKDKPKKHKHNYKTFRVQRAERRGYLRLWQKCEGCGDIRVKEKAE